LRTPLTTIKTSCELLEQDAAITGKARTRLLQVERAANNMSDLVNALLLLARDESESEITPVRLADAIADALDGFTDTLTAKALEPHIEVDLELRVQVNQSALAIVLSNLIGNAVQHTDRGGIRFSYHAGELCVEDTGCGIPSDSLPLVFERFYRATPASERGRGFGLGLAIVKKICDRYRWPIRIESETGAGTRVYLGLPLLQ
jgi:signal transduction histidine kinase